MTQDGGSRLFGKVERLDNSLVEAARGVAVANLADAMHGLGVAQGLKVVGSFASRIVGSAVTVDVTPGDGLYSRIALSVCRPGDVLVINAHGCVTRAVLGGSVCIAAMKRGVAGIIVDGAVRDIGEIEGIGIGVMAREVICRSGTTSAGWGEVNVPVALGGVVVMPGDLVLADREGCVVVPGTLASSVIERVRAVEVEKGKPEELQERIVRAGDEITGYEVAAEVLDERGSHLADRGVRLEEY